MGERLNRTQEVDGSIPFSSTKTFPLPTFSSRDLIEPSTDVGGSRGQSPLLMERDDGPLPAKRERASSIPFSSTKTFPLPTFSSRDLIEPSTDVGGSRGQSPLLMERDDGPLPAKRERASSILVSSTKTFSSNKN